MNSPLYRLVTDLTPDTAVLLATLGVGLIFLEFNRPGRALPGALGLLLTLLAASRLSRFGLRPWAIGLLACCTAAYLLNLWRRLPGWLLAMAILGSIVAVRFLLLVPGQPAVRTSVAVLCGGSLGGASAVLTRVAHRARRSKALD